MVVQAIRVTIDETDSPIYIQVDMATDRAQLVVMGASRYTEDEWDQAMRFCWEAGWEPRQDEPDITYRETDTEIYVLLPIEDDEEEDEDIEHGRQAESLQP